MLAWFLTGRTEAADTPEPLRIASDSLTAVVSSGLAVIMLLRVRRQARWNDLVLAAGFCLTATGAVMWRFVLPSLGQPLEQDPDVALMRLISGAALAVAAWLPARRLPGGRERISATIVVAASIALGLALVTLGQAVTAAGQAGSDAVHALHGAAAAFLGVAAVGMWRQYTRTHDVLWWWLGLASAVLAVSRFQLAWSHSGPPDTFHAGDHLPLFAVSIALAAGVAEIGRHWRHASEAVAHVQARHLAEETHDGLVQEILYIRRHARGLPESDGREDIERAATRAEAHARALMQTLENFGPTSTVDAIRREALEAAARFGVHAVVDLPAVDNLSDAQRRVVVRAVHEGIANVARHGDTATAHVELRRRGRHAIVVVRDDGPGYDTSSTPLGYGLSSLARDAAELGGSLRIHSRPGRGTQLEVTV